MNYLKLFILMAVGLLFSCKRLIKNDNATVTNEIDSLSSATTQRLSSTAPNSNTQVNTVQDLYGYWVGYFKNANDEDFEKNVAADEGLYWARENKINISIDEISGDKVSGHSVVAGNNRPFSGTFIENNDAYNFQVSEPGDDKYDGKFTFMIKKNDTLLTGTWKAFKKINIQERKYELTKKIFSYNSNQMLEYARGYGNWENSKKIKITDADERDEYGDFYEEFETATNKIYEINASNKLLTKKDVENLKKGDLLIIRNTIYARHGYSFKNRPLRVFFDAQPWYIPVHTDIKAALTAVEKKNIELLLRYEKNAKTYYDSFGRG